MTHADEYAHLGHTVIDLIPEREAERLARRAIAVAVDAHTVRREATGVFEAGDEGGAYAYRVLDTLHVQKYLRELWGLYLALPALVELVVRREIILSPYGISAVNVKVYEPGAEQGWHLDTNAVTALLYLTSDGHPTVLDDLQGERVHLAPGAGRLLLMQGRRVRHCVPPVPAGVQRVTCPLNLYHPDDTYRPEGIDQIVYGARASLV